MTSGLRCYSGLTVQGNSCGKRPRCRCVLRLVAVCGGKQCCKGGGGMRDTC